VQKKGTPRLAPRRIGPIPGRFGRWGFASLLWEEIVDWVFAGTGPLHSFIAKIEIAFALGIISEKLRAELLLIGRIRNKFAHDFRRVRFSDPGISKLCDQLREFDKAEAGKELGSGPIKYLADQMIG
jgi:DNA-binding MltR family transcriptional regulator